MGKRRPVVNAMQKQGALMREDNVLLPVYQRMYFVTYGIMDTNGALSDPFEQPCLHVIAQGLLRKPKLLDLRGGNHVAVSR